jgi:hypothetical protein
LAQAILSQTFTFTNTIANSSQLFFLLTPPMKLELTECSETSGHKIQTPGNCPEERMQLSENSESLK